MMLNGDKSIVAISLRKIGPLLRKNMGVQIYLEGHADLLDFFTPAESMYRSVNENQFLIS